MIDPLKTVYVMPAHSKLSLVLKQKYLAGVRSKDRAGFSPAQRTWPIEQIPHRPEIRPAKGADLLSDTGNQAEEPSFISKRRGCIEGQDIHRLKLSALHKGDDARWSMKRHIRSDGRRWGMGRIQPTIHCLFNAKDGILQVPWSFMSYMARVAECCRIC